MRPKARNKAYSSVIPYKIEEANTSIGKSPPLIYVFGG